MPQTLRLVHHALSLRRDTGGPEIREPGPSLLQLGLPQLTQGPPASVSPTATAAQCRANAPRKLQHSVLDRFCSGSCSPPVVDAYQAELCSYEPRVSAPALCPCPAPSAASGRANSSDRVRPEPCRVTRARPMRGARVRRNCPLRALSCSLRRTGGSTVRDHSVLIPTRDRRHCRQRPRAGAHRRSTLNAAAGAFSPACKRLTDRADCRLSDASPPPYFDEQSQRRTVGTAQRMARPSERVLPGRNCWNSDRGDRDWPA